MAYIGVVGVGHSGHGEHAGHGGGFSLRGRGRFFGGTYTTSCTQWSTPVSNALLSPALLNAARYALLASASQPAVRTLGGTTYLFTLENNQIVVRTCIATGVAGVGQTPNAISYRVKPGDSFGSITRAFTGSDASWQALAYANPGIKVLRVGQLLNIPTAWMQQQSASASSSSGGMMTQPMGGGGSFVHSTSSDQGRQVSRIEQAIGLGRAYPMHGQGVGVAPVPNLGSIQPSSDPIGKLSSVVSDGMIGLTSTPAPAPVDVPSTPLIFSTAAGTFQAADPSMTFVDPLTTAPSCGAYVSLPTSTPTATLAILGAQAANIDNGTSTTSTVAGTMPAGIYYIAYNGSIYQFTKPATGPTTVTGVCTPVTAPATTTCPTGYTPGPNGLCVPVGATPVVYTAPSTASTTWTAVGIGVAALALGVGAAYMVSRPHKTPEEIAHEEARNFGMR